MIDVMQLEKNLKTAVEPYKIFIITAKLIKISVAIENKNFLDLMK